MRSNNEILKTRKNSLARLLATEDLVIEHKKVPTAYFEVDKRRLVCPILKDDMSAQLYDLFMGHEVGHALITPADGWHDAVSEKGAKYKGYLNVLEDVRIEKHIKSKYAGLRKIFYDAYSELHNDLDFFGVKGYNVNKLAFIDRINLYFKIGHKIMIDFSKEEQKIINQIDTKMDTWEKVVKVADYLYELSKLENLEPQTDKSMQTVETSEGDGDTIPQDFDEQEGEGDAEESLGGNQESENESEEESEDGAKGTESTDEDGDEESSDSDSVGEGDIEKSQNLEGGEFGEEGGQSGNAPQDDNAKESITDKNFRNNEDKLHEELDEWDREPSYMDFNSKDFKAKDITIPYKKMIADITRTMETGMKEYEHSTDTLANSREYTEKFLDHNKNVINYMAKEFDMRKAASAYKKSMSAKTGEIDMSKIHQYLLKDDIFKRATIVPDGKNHGVIMLVDWSGSMYDAIRETYEQSIVLTMFCRRVGIPHRVYAFTDAWRENVNEYDHDEVRKGKFVPNNSLRLIELFSDKMNKRDFKESCVVMNAQLESMCDGGYYYRGKSGSRFEAGYSHNYDYSLGGTPLDESLMFMRDYIADFKHNYSIDKLQFVTLTDGDSFRLNGMGYSNEQNIHDRRTKSTFTYRSGNYARNGTDNLLKWIEETTGVDTVGFFICPNKHRDFDHAVDKFSGAYNEWDVKAEGYKLFRREGGYSVSTTDKSGYKEFYILNKKKMGIVSEDDTLDVDAGASKQALKGAMKRMGNNKMSQRKILQHFVKKVA
jgi:hypothetical protein